MTKSVFISLMVLSLWVSSSAQQSSNTTLIGSWGAKTGDSKTVAVSGDIVYTNEGRWFKVIYVLNSSKPVLMGQLELPDEPDHMYVNGDYVYVVGADIGLIIIDVSAPDSPTIAWSSHEYDYFRMDLFVDSSHVYLITDSLFIFKIKPGSDTPPLSQFELNLISKYFIFGQLFDIVVDSIYAYIAAGTEGIKIVDISDSANPIEIGQYKQQSNYITLVNVSGGYAYIYNDKSQDPALIIINISDRSNPIEVGRYTFGSTYIGSTALAVKGSNVYVTSRSSTSVFNVSDPSNPQYKSSLSSFANDIVIQGNFAYLASFYRGLNIFSIANINNPDLVGNYRAIGRADHVTLLGNKAYVAAGEDGLAVVNISNQSFPKTISTFGTYGRTVNDIIPIDFSHILLAKEDRSNVINISDPLNPKQISQDFFYGYDLQSMAVVCGTAYLPERIIDLSDLINPKKISDFYTGFSFSTVKQLIIKDSYAYLAVNERPYQGTEFFGLRIFDISDNQNPAKVGFLATGGFIRDMVISDNYAYVAVDDSGVYIIDISDPTNPTKIMNFLTTQPVQGLAIMGDHLYLAEGLQGLRIFSVSDPLNPLEVAYYDEGDPTLYASDVEVRGSFAFVMYADEGMKIIRNELSSDPAVFAEVYPGDTNNDCVVDIRDILPIAVHYERIGPARENASLDWKPQPLSKLWTINSVSFVDVDGNGVINAEDVKGIIQNWSATPSDGVPASFNIAIVAQDILREIDAQPTSKAISEIREVIMSYIEEELGIVLEYQLEQNYPNPFNSATKIRFDIPQEISSVQISIFNILGQLVWERSLINVEQGNHEIKWNGNSNTGIEVSSGIYFYKISAGNYTKVKRMVFLK